VTGPELTRATAGQVAAARTAAGALGLYFQLAVPAGPGWLPASRLYAPGPGGPLDELLDSVQERLGGCERRVAASLFYQGYAARLLSPQLGCIATGGCLPEIAANRLSWREPPAEMIQLAWRAGQGWRGQARPLLSQLLIQSFTAHLRPLETAIRTRVKIPAAVLQDNAASALISGLRLLDSRLGDGGWRPLAEHALADQALHGSGNLRAAEPAFTRRSCCLYYRAPDGGLCGDCPLA
jgi:ferric iron reductase protein FhuF